jgi:hypothetical protein
MPPLDMSSVVKNADPTIVESSPPVSLHATFWGQSLFPRTAMHTRSLHPVLKFLALPAAKALSPSLQLGRSGTIPEATPRPSQPSAVAIHPSPTTPAIAQLAEPSMAVWASWAMPHGALLSSTCSPLPRSSAETLALIDALPRELIPDPSCAMSKAAAATISS